MVENYPVILRMKISDPHLIYGAKKVTAPVRVCPALLSIYFAPSLRKSWFQAPLNRRASDLLNILYHEGQIPRNITLQLYGACPKDPEHVQKIQRIQKIPKKYKEIQNFPWNS